MSAALTIRNDRPRILVVCTRRLGDVLLCTPLVRSLRSAWPRARIDLLVNAGTGAILEGNPDIDHVIGADGGVLRLLRRYDLALPVLPSDRSHLTAMAAAPVRVGVVPPQGGRWKRWACRRHVTFDGHARHTVVQSLMLADCLGIARHPQVVPPEPTDPAATRERLLAAGLTERRVVLHPAAMYRYKAWTAPGWIAVARFLIDRGFQVVLSGGPGASEREYVGSIAAGLPVGRVLNFAGQLRLSELTPVLRGAAAYVGPDTSVTHQAAACDTPTIALFGPSNPMAWGPWPQGHAGPGESPWQLASPLQRRGNVTLVQGLSPCVPCLQEGCERKLDSRADCLDQLPPVRVIDALRRILPQ